MDVVRLGVLGGTFDPIHNGHLGLAEAAYAQLALGRILFVPAAEPPHKQGRRITAVEHRLKMVELAVQGHPHFEVSRVDIDRPGPHYSVDMIVRLRATYHVAAEDCFFHHRQRCADRPAVVARAGKATSIVPPGGYLPAGLQA